MADHGCQLLIQGGEKKENFAGKTLLWITNTHSPETQQLSGFLPLELESKKWVQPVF